MTELERVRKELDIMQGSLIDLKIQSSLHKAAQEIHEERLDKLDQLGELVKKRNTQLGIIVACLVFFSKWLNADAIFKFLTGSH